MRPFARQPTILIYIKTCLLERVQEMVVEYVGVRAVTQVVTQTCNCHISDVLFPDIQFRLLLLKFPHHLLRYVACADAMFKSVM